MVWFSQKPWHCDMGSRRFHARKEKEEIDNGTEFVPCGEGVPWA